MGFWMQRGFHHGLPSWLLGLGMACACVLAGPSSVAAQSGGLDYPQWRGPNRDGSAAEFEEPARWPEELTLQWQAEVGTGYGTPLVIGPIVYTFTRQDGDEVLTAFEAATGRVVWTSRYEAPFRPNAGTDGHGPGPKSTPLHYRGTVYTLGIGGVVSAFDVDDGTIRWQHPAPPVDPLYATAMSPLADGDRVIFHVGGHDQGALVAFDASSGDVVWSWDGDGPAYASPILAELGGTRQIVTVTQEQVVGIDPETGALLWQRSFESNFTNNSITPIVYDDSVIVSGHELGVTRFRPAQRGAEWVTETLWHNDEVGLFMSNGVVVDDLLFSLSHRNSGQYFALDIGTGETVWRTRGREAENTAFVKAGGVLLLLNDDAELIVVRPTRDGFQPIHRYQVSERPTWAQPTISGNRVFVKDETTLSLWTVE